MATIKFGSIVVDARGKIGGHVFQKGNQSRVLKTGGKPRVNLSSTKSITQAFIQAASSAYNGLSESLKLGWASASETMPFKNKFGDVFYYTSRQFFMWAYVNQLKAGFTPLPNPSGFNTLVQVGFLSSAVFNTGTSRLDLTGTGFVADRRFLLKMFASYSGTSQPNLNRFVYMGNSSVLTSNSLPFWNAFVARYGMPNSSMNIWIAVYSVNNFGVSKSPVLFKASVS